MTRSGFKLLGLGILLLAVGIPLAYLVDSLKGTAASITIVASLILFLSGAALLFYGIYKIIAGKFKHQ